MIFCKFQKLASAAYVPHLDTLRAVGMAIRRTGLDIAYSEGFNPHMQLFFNQPLPIGTQSTCEYFCAYSAADPAEFMQKMNATLPAGVRILAAGKVDKDPNIANLMFTADYEMRFSEKLSEQDADAFFGADKVEIAYTAKGESCVKDVKSKIFSHKTEGDRLFCRVSCGNDNLRADRLGNSLARALGVKLLGVTRVALYGADGKNVDERFF